MSTRPEQRAQTKPVGRRAWTPQGLPTNATVAGLSLNNPRIRAQVRKQCETGTVAPALFTKLLKLAYGPRRPAEKEGARHERPVVFVFPNEPWPQPRGRAQRTDREIAHLLTLGN